MTIMKYPVMTSFLVIPHTIGCLQSHDHEWDHVTTKWLLLITLISMTRSFVLVDPIGSSTNQSAQCLFVPMYYVL